MEKILIFLLAIILCSCAPSRGAAYYCDYEYSILDDGTICFYGIEKNSRRDFKEHFSVPETIYGIKVTKIGNNAFYNSHYDYSFTSISIPSSVKQIGDEAFLGCSDLREISLSDNLESIGKNAFYGCYYLDSISLPETLVSIGEKALNNIEKITLKSKEPPQGTFDIPFSDGLKIYIPAESVEAYKTDSFWSAYNRYMYYYLDDIEKVVGLSPVTNLAFSSNINGTSSAFSLSWSKIEDAEQYQVYTTSSLMAPDWTLYGSVSSCSTTVKTSYQFMKAFKVIAVNNTSDINSSSSNIIYYSSSDNFVCAGNMTNNDKTVTLYAIRVGKDKLKLYWNNSESYIVLRKINNEVVSRCTLESSGTSYTYEDSEVFWLTTSTSNMSEKDNARASNYVSIRGF